MKDLAGQSIDVGDNIVLTTRVGTRYRPALAVVTEVSPNAKSEELSSCMAETLGGRKESRYLNEVVVYKKAAKQKGKAKVEEAGQ
jgi:hypothetical protein